VLLLPLVVLLVVLPLRRPRPRRRKKRRRSLTRTWASVSSIKCHKKLKWAIKKLRHAENIDGCTTVAVQVSLKAGCACCAQVSKCFGIVKPQPRILRKIRCSRARSCKYSSSNSSRESSLNLCIIHRKSSGRARTKITAKTLAPQAETSAHLLNFRCSETTPRLSFLTHPRHPRANSQIP